MDDEKDETPAANPPADEPGPADGKHHLTESVSNLITSTASAIAETVKDAAGSIVQLAKTPPVISGRIETAHPPVEENFDAPPMTAEQLAEHAAAETQPVAVAQREKRKVSAKKAASTKAAKASLPKASKKRAGKKAAKTSGKKAKKAVSKKRSKKRAKTFTKKMSKKTSKKLSKTKSKKAKRSKR